MNYSKLLKYIREELLVSQTELAHELGVAFATVNRTEMGHHIHNLATRRKIRDFCEKNKINAKKFKEEK